tara:strand:+ start:1277 stop:1438 length:162 start_codon:yes stop_codon:yes gene_type:complete
VGDGLKSPCNHITIENNGNKLIPVICNIMMLQVAVFEFAFYSLIEKEQRQNWH